MKITQEQRDYLALYVMGWAESISYDHHNWYDGDVLACAYGSWRPDKKDDQADMLVAKIDGSWHIEQSG